MSRYLTLCNYVSQKTGISGSLAILFNLAAGATIGNAGYYLTTDPKSVLECILLTLFAIGVQGPTEAIMLTTLKHNKIGLTKGGMILRSTQIGTFFAPFILAASVHLAQPTENKAASPKPEGPAPTISLEAR